MLEIIPSELLIVPELKNRFWVNGSKNPPRFTEFAKIRFESKDKEKLIPFTGSAGVI